MSTRGEDTTDLEVMSCESVRSWNVFRRSIPRSEITFFSQVIIIYIVIVTCIVNLSVGNGDSNLWTALLSSCLGYLLPSPSIRKDKMSRIIDPASVSHSNS